MDGRIHLWQSADGRCLEKSLTQPPGDSELFLVCGRFAILQAWFAVAGPYGVLVDGLYFFWPIQDGERCCDHEIPYMLR